MRTIAMRLAYDGTDFVGSQWQNTGRSVQGELEGAWFQLTQEQRRFVFAGRTDAGVHAQGQIAHVQTETHHALATIQRGCNAWLPSDVVIRDVWEVAPNFHARHSAIRREYRYLIADTPVLLPLLRHYVMHVEQPLDDSAIQTALAFLHGRHDFAAFTSQSASQGSTIRRCYEARCLRVEVLGQTLLAIDLAANAFLQHMVRMIVGTVVLVGRGRIPPAQVERILQERDRRQAGPTAAAHGLCLMAVIYPPHMLPPGAS